MTEVQSFHVDVVFSHDDGGYYLHKYDFTHGCSWTSRKTYRTRDGALNALRSGRVKWEG